MKNILLCLFATFCFHSLPASVIPHCSPNCTACPDCEFCGSNCTLTQGFWKNHTECWPAAFDPGAKSTCGILWTTILDSPVKGRPWYNLAHQWIAAELNHANGADISCVDCTECFNGCADILSEVEDLLIAGCVDKDSKDANELFNCLAMLLDDYNNGQVDGCPEHCGGENPCATCDCGFCCPFDCELCVDCPNRCEGCENTCPDPCPECPACPACPACPDCNCPNNCPDPCPACPDCNCPSTCPDPCPPCPACPDCICNGSSGCPDCICPACPDCVCKQEIKQECSKSESNHRHHHRHHHHRHHHHCENNQNNQNNENNDRAEVRRRHERRAA